LEESRLTGLKIQKIATRTKTTVIKIRRPITDTKKLLDQALKCRSTYGAQTKHKGFLGNPFVPLLAEIARNVP
jgi:hypothetical protein